MNKKCFMLHIAYWVCLHVYCSNKMYVHVLMYFRFICNLYYVHIITFCMFTLMIVLSNIMIAVWNIKPTGLLHKYDLNQLNDILTDC